MGWVVAAPRWPPGATSSRSPGGNQAGAARHGAALRGAVARFRHTRAREAFPRGGARPLARRRSCLGWRRPRPPLPPFAPLRARAMWCSCYEAREIPDPPENAQVRERGAVVATRGTRRDGAVLSARPPTGALPPPPPFVSPTLSLPPDRASHPAPHPLSARPIRRWTLLSPRVMVMAMAMTRAAREARQTGQAPRPRRARGGAKRAWRRGRRRGARRVSGGASRRATPRRLGAQTSLRAASAATQRMRRRGPRDTRPHLLDMPHARGGG